MNSTFIQPTITDPGLKPNVLQNAAPSNASSYMSYFSDIKIIVIVILVILVLFLIFYIFKTKPNEESVNNAVRERNNEHAVNNFKEEIKRKLEMKNSERAEELRQIDEELKNTAPQQNLQQNTQQSEMGEEEIKEEVIGLDEQE